jgi:S-formylglutathione hydrolase FrmB
VGSSTIMGTPWYGVGMKATRTAVGLFLVSLSPSLGAAVRTSSFHSSSLGREVGYSVDLPPSFGDGKPLPVLYVLHGLFEGPDFWERRGLSTIVHSLWKGKEVPEFIVVAVDGSNSFFVNGPQGAYEDLVTRDLVAQVERSYPAIARRQGRALLGVSMGGYAALRIGFKHPDLFGAVAAHSAMLLESIPRPDDGAGRWQMAAFHEVFGDPIDPKLWSESNPLQLVERVTPGTAPALYFDCGAQDRYGLFAGNTDLHRRLEAHGIPHEFGLYPGDHGYEYVRSVLERSLRFMGRVLGAP